MHIVLKRLTLAVPTLLVLSLTVFLMLEWTPGDASAAVLDDAQSAAADEQIRAEVGADQPLLPRYVTYLGGVLRGDMGVSARSGRAVSEELALRLPYTLKLTAGAMLVAVLVGGGLGVIAAAHQNRFWDDVITALISAGMALPTFWIAILLVWLFALQLGWLPVFGVGTPQHYVLPVVSVAISLVPGIARMTRISLLEVANQPFVTVAHGKGLRQERVFWRHVASVAAIPVITYIGLQSVNLVGSVVTIEVIFNYPGLGGLAVQAALDQDPLLLQGVTLTIAVFAFVMLTLTDFLVLLLDPRIKR